MAKFIPLQKAEHADKAWVRPLNYDFAAKEAVIPVVAMEAAVAAVNMPLAFVRQEKLTALVAITGPAVGENVFVAKDGRWLGAYIPAVLRSYPFRLARIEGREEMALCVEQGSLATSGEPFYDDAGNLAPLVKNSATMLEIHEKSRQQTMFAAAALNDAGVLTPWPVKFKSSKDGGEITLKGVLKIDEQALGALDEDAFIKLRKVGALPLAYAQLISMSRLSTLGRMAEMRDRLAAAPAQKSPQPSLDFLREEDGNIVF